MAFSWNPFARNKKQDVQPQNGFNRNQNFEAFRALNNDISRAILSRSVINQNIEADHALATNPSWQIFSENGLYAMPVTSNKSERIAQYRNMAKYTQTQWCLDEIADEFIHTDEHGNFINLTLPENDPRFNDIRKDILQNEFRKYIELFNLKENGHTLMKRFLVEGELAWENIINKDYLRRGIIGIKFLPAEYYETLVDLNNNTPVGILFDTEKMDRNIREILSNNYVASAQVFNAISPVSFSFGFNKNKCVPMLWPQITYINSGDYDLEGTFVSQPMIEKAKQAYYQLTLLQDAAVILRVTRAPERLLFNVGTGKMTDNYADEYVRNFANNLKAKKVAKANGSDISQVYNPVTMLESYIFRRSDGSEGTTVESVTSSAQYDQIEDIKYFFRLFVKQFKVPFSRFEQPENAKPADNQIPQEEFAFLQQEVRLQRRFAAGFKKGFITHLKLRDIWDKYELTESDIKVDFVEPLLYKEYTKLQILETKMNAYKAVVDNEEFSKTLAMKKILGYSDSDIEENYRALIKDACINAVSEFWSGKVSEGPLGEFSKPPIPIKGFEDPVKAAIEGKNEEGESEEGSEGKEGEEDNEDSSESEAGSEAPAEPEKPEETEPAPATFGLG